MPLRVVTAVRRYTDVEAYGFCNASHEGASGYEWFARLVGRTHDQIDVVTAGLNHFSWLVSIHDRETGEELYVYHGNDGTSMPWNDTAQLDYTRADVREAVIQTILAVARRSPSSWVSGAFTSTRFSGPRCWAWLSTSCFATSPRPPTAAFQPDSRRASS